MTGNQQQVLGQKELTIKTESEQIQLAEEIK